MLIYLRDKPADDYTGLEAYVEDKLRRGDASFFPLVATDRVLDDNLDLTEEDVFLMRTQCLMDHHLADEAEADPNQASAIMPPVDEVLQTNAAPTDSNRYWDHRVDATLMKLQDGLDTTMDREARTAAKVDRVESSVRSMNEAIQQIMTLQAKSWRLQELQASRIDKMQCHTCGFIFDDAANGPFDELPVGWTCPGCGGPSRLFSSARLDQAVITENKLSRSSSARRSLSPELTKPVALLSASPDRPARASAMIAAVDGAIEKVDNANAEPLEPRKPSGFGRASYVRTLAAHFAEQPGEPCQPRPSVLPLLPSRLQTNLQEEPEVEPEPEPEPEPQPQLQQQEQSDLESLDSGSTRGSVPSLPLMGGGTRTMQEAKDCYICHSEFTFTRRRHHCRDCGNSVCSVHSVGRATLPHRDTGAAPQRVCDICLQRLDPAQLDTIVADRVHRHL